MLTAWPLERKRQWDWGRGIMGTLIYYSLDISVLLIFLIQWGYYNLLLYNVKKNVRTKAKI